MHVAGERPADYPLSRLRVDLPYHGLGHSRARCSGLFLTQDAIASQASGAVLSLRGVQAGPILLRRDICLCEFMNLFLVARRKCEQQTPGQ